MQIKDNGLYEMRGGGRVRIKENMQGTFACEQAEPFIRWDFEGGAYCVGHPKDFLTKGRRKALKCGNMDLLFEVDESVWVPVCKDLVQDLIKGDPEGFDWTLRLVGRHWQTNVTRDVARELAITRNAKKDLESFGLFVSFIV